MARIISLVAICCCIFSVYADISLSGIVKKKGGTAGIGGATVTLAKVSGLSASTGPDGSFLLADGVQVKNQAFVGEDVRIVCNNSVIRFSSPLSGAKGCISLFSAAGERIFFHQFASRSRETVALTLPRTGSGIYLLSITINGTEYTHTVARVGGQIHFRSTDAGKYTRNPAYALEKIAATDPVDTLVVSKTGYKTARLPVASYLQNNLSIELDSASSTSGCTREIILVAVKTYLDALEAADPSLMDKTDDAKYTENLKVSAMGEGIWKTKIKVNFHRDFCDVDSCKAYTEIIDNVSDHPYNIGAQLQLNDEGKITVVSALVADSGDWALKTKSDFTKQYTISSGENWSVIPVDKQDTRATIKAAGDAYLDDFKDSTKVKVPWGTPCARLEGSMYTGNANNLEAPNTSCNVGVPQGLDMLNRIYVIDVDMGTVDIFCKFGGSMPDSHLFRVENGKLRFVHTISIQGK